MIYAGRSHLPVQKEIIMKRTLAFLLTFFMICMGLNLTAYAEEVEDLSQPRFMVSSYKLDTDSVTASKKSTLEITFKNYSKTKAIKNIKLSAADESGELDIDGTGTAYVEKISAGASYVWKLSLKATPAALTGNHKLNITSEFEDGSGEVRSSADIITLYIKGNAPTSADAEPSQPRIMVTSYKVKGTKLLPNKKTKASVTVKNFSKTKAVHNVKLSIVDETGEVKLNGAGAIIIEKIDAGKSYKWNFNLTASKTAQSGVHKLTMTAEYEDAGGNVFSSGDSINVNVKGTAAAEEGTEAQASSQPRVMVTNYFVNSGYIQPSKTTDLEITFKNFNKSAAVSNIKLSILDESGELETKGMPTAYVDKIGANGTYVWKLSLKALNTAQIGEHKLSVTCEYEDSKFQTYSANDIILVNVKQSVSLDYSGLELAPKSIQGDTQSVSVTMMNTGKTVLDNCKVDFDIKGLTGSGTLFIGQIPAGESKEGTANLRVSEDLLGETNGTATISYDDAYGETHTETVKLSTTIEEQIETNEEEEEEKKSKYPLWWLFLILGLAFGGGIGCAVPIAIQKSKERKEDELRL